MGLSDRDYMVERQRKRAASSTEEISASTALWTLLIFTSVFFLLFKIFSAWETSRKTPPRAQEPARMQTQTPQSLAPRNAPVNREMAAAPPVQAQSAIVAPAIPVTKCVTRHGTSYQEGPCVGGATTTTIWIHQEVTNNEAPVRTVALQTPPETNYSPPVLTAPPVSISQTYDPRAAECGLLTEELHKWDERARQPLSGQMQDWIRDRQRTLRARQFELKC